MDSRRRRAKGQLDASCMESKGHKDRTAPPPSSQQAISLHESFKILSLMSSSTSDGEARAGRKVGVQFLATTPPSLRPGSILSILNSSP